MAPVSRARGGGVGKILRGLGPPATDPSADRRTDAAGRAALATDHRAAVSRRKHGRDAGGEFGCRVDLASRERRAVSATERTCLSRLFSATQTRRSRKWLWGHRPNRPVRPADKAAALASTFPRPLRSFGDGKFLSFAGENRPAQDSQSFEKPTEDR
jgi:hypothetical protein